jgi:lysophospholipid acyltransferase (LPLAT)-like uncharacterized protein
MKLWRRIGRQQWAKTALGVFTAKYVRFVGKTTRLTIEPPDAWDRAEADMPIIIAFWHGQHLLATNASKPSYKVKTLVSHHHDAEILAIAAERLGVGTIRGSGNHSGSFVHKGGVAAFQAMLDALAEGYSVVLSADVPKVSRVAGRGSRHHQARANLRPADPCRRHRHALAHRARQLGPHHHQSAVQPRRRRGYRAAARPCGCR